MLIPAKFAASLPVLYGEKGEAWLSQLPERLEACAEIFGLEFGRPFPDLSWNLLLHARTLAEGSRVVLKLSPTWDELAREAAWLSHFAGRGAVSVLQQHRGLAAIVLEEVYPGVPLSSLTDDNLATDIFCSVFRRLYLTDTGEAGADQSGDASGDQLGHDQLTRPLFPTLTEHFAAIHRYVQGVETGERTEVLPESWVNHAVSELAQLLETTKHTRLLHGDLHHMNILSGDEWSVIDAKGILGDVHFEVIQYLLNFMDRGGDGLSVLHRRIDQIARALPLEGSRIARWGVVRGVLEACWSLEGTSGGGAWREGIAIAELFHQVLEAPSP